MKSSSLVRTARVELKWSHQGEGHRVSGWPEVIFEREQSGRWVEYVPDPSNAEFASAERTLRDRDWRALLELMPPRERAFVNLFQSGRLAALALLAECPEVVEDLMGAPAIVPFLACHLVLRGGSLPRWKEISAIHERGGLFSLLEWLGLPASRETLALLRRVIRPDLSRSLLEPVRRALWQPATLWLLRQSSALTEQDLRTFCRLQAA